jgi:hypothetical protein
MLLLLLLLQPPMLPLLQSMHHFLRPPIAL